MTLQATELRCVRGDREIFRDLSFAVGSGEMLAVTGANGAGKSSLLRMIAGLLPLAGGVIHLDTTTTESPLIEQAHYLGHRDPLKPALSVIENLTFWLEFLDGEASAANCLETVGLTHAAQLPSAFLSAGQRRRLSMARLFGVKRPVWLLDEPTTALDAQGQSLLTSMITAHLASGGIVLAATHGALGIAARELRIGA